MFNSDKKYQAYLSYDNDRDDRYVDRLLEGLHNHIDFYSAGPIDDRDQANDPGYVTDLIKNEYLSLSSVTIVLCGANTFKKKKIDWEICATLENKQALMGLILPDAEKVHNGKVIVPERLMDNVKSQYATCIGWSTNPNYIKKNIAIAMERRKNAFLIKNDRPVMTKDLGLSPRPPSKDKESKKQIYYSP